jgi:hypothetical protein
MPLGISHVSLSLPFFCDGHLCLALWLVILIRLQVTNVVNAGHFENCIVKI